MPVESQAGNQVTWNAGTGLAYHNERRRRDAGGLTDSEMEILNATTADSDAVAAEAGSSE